MTSWQRSLGLIPPVGGTFLESREFMQDDQGQEQAGAGVRTLWEKISDKCRLLYPASLISSTKISRPRTLLEHSLSHCATSSIICEGCQLHHHQLSQHLNLENLLFGDWSPGSLFGGKPPAPARSLGNPMAQQQHPALALNGGLPPLASSINPKKSNLFEDVAVRSSALLGFGGAVLSYTPPGPGSQFRGFMTNFAAMSTAAPHCFSAPTGKNGLGASFN
ncbi:hypothetical protein K439DRAFT_1638709, partial [Ramaria rubella]